MTEKASTPPTKETVLIELKRIAAHYSFKYFQKKEFTYHAEHATSKEVTRFFGSWNKALKEAGVTEFPEKPKRVKKESGSVTRDLLLIELVTVWMKLAAQPIKEEWRSHSKKFSVRQYEQEFGSWEQALEATKSLPESVENELFPDQQNEQSGEPAQKFHKRTIPAPMQVEVMKRSRNRCNSCGKEHMPDEGCLVKVVYIKPPSKGGRATLSNLKTLCNFCIDATKKRTRWY